MKLIRDPVRLDGITGKLFNDEGYQIAVTLERNYNGKPKVPEGTYRCIRRYSPKFEYDVFMLVDVPGHDYIEFHVANWQRDLDGCIGLGHVVCGSEHGVMITDSNLTFSKFMSDLAGVDYFMLTIESES